MSRSRFHGCSCFMCRSALGRTGPHRQEIDADERERLGVAEAASLDRAGLWDDERWDDNWLSEEDLGATPLRVPFLEAVKIR
jgi:hypothetical protein